MKTGAVSLSRRLLSDQLLLLTGVFYTLFLCGAIATENIWIPTAILLLPGSLYLVCFKLKWLFRFLFLIIPLSMELELPGGLSTDIPGEPILWLLTIVTGIFLIYKGLPQKAYNGISLLLLLHLAWIFGTSLFAFDTQISFKYAFAKTWYILPFYLLPFYLLNKLQEVRQLLKWFLIGSLIGAFYFFIQHLQTDLSYLSRTNAGIPIWRNHVNYACTLVLNLPMIWFLHRTSKHPDRWMYIVNFILILVFIYFAYSRIVYLAIIATLGYYLILRFKWTKQAIAASFIGIVFLLMSLVEHKQYVHLAPDFDRTIMQPAFENKLSATAQGEDISTMERIHRWVAAGRMIRERPWIGFGPGNFYPAYRPYTLFSFETYVSNNPERSGIHNNYLMIFVEQGIIGGILFLLICIISLVKIENLYHQISTPTDRSFVLLLGCLLTMMLTINIVNDLIETIKLGSIFFLVLSLLFFKFEKAAGS